MIVVCCSNSSGRGRESAPSRARPWSAPTPVGGYRCGFVKARLAMSISTSSDYNILGDPVGFCRFGRQQKQSKATDLSRLSTGKCCMRDRGSAHAGVRYSDRGRGVGELLLSLRFPAGETEENEVRTSASAGHVIPAARLPGAQGPRHEPNPIPPNPAVHCSLVRCDPHQRMMSHTSSAVVEEVCDV
jgi:hypothetical protein